MYAQVVLAHKTGNGDWADCLPEMDYRIRQILDAIKEVGIEDNTIRRLVLTIAICGLVCAGSVAQQTESGKLPNSPSTSAQTTTQGSNPLQGGMAVFQLLQRKSLVFPDLATNKEPFGRWDKFKLAANNSVSLATIGAALCGAAYGQAINSPAGYGQGGEGYGKRFGANMARAASNNVFGTFLIASILHEDPRFYVRKNLSFKQSVKYSAARVAITRSDSGERAVNFAGLLGPLAGEALANTYYPEGNRGVGSTLTRYASDLGWRFAGNLLRQYWPSINKKLRLVPGAPELATTRGQNPGDDETRKPGDVPEFVPSLSVQKP